jgi:hypothetical protein
VAHSREDAEDILGPHLEDLGIIFPAAWNGWESLGEKAPELRMLCGKRSRASLVSDFAVDKAGSVFAGRSPSVILRDGRKFLLLEFDSQLCVRLNKFRSGTRQMGGIHTRQRQAFAAQEPLTGMPESTNLVLGYDLNADETEIASVAITCSTNNSLNWEIDVPLPGETIAIDTHAPRPDVPSPQITSARPKDQDKAESGA